MMKILYIGCVESSYILLKKLVQIKADIVGVITKKESTYNSDFMDLASLCMKYNIKYCYVDNINNTESVKFIEKTQAEMAFCFGWSELIREEIIDMFPKGIIGFHPAELPNNRGRHPSIWALVLGLTKTASTFFMLDKGADTGDIVSQKVIDIQYEDDATTLYKKIMTVAEQQIVELYGNIENDSVTRFSQQDKKGNTWRKRSKRDGEIDFRMSSRAIYNLVRGLTHPYVGAHFVLEGKDVKVWKVAEVHAKGYENIEPGKVIAVNKDGTVDIKTYDNIIRILESDEFSVKEGEYL